MPGPRELAQYPKELISSDSIAKGEIETKHLSPGLFREIGRIQTHGHEGATSKRIDHNAIESRSNLIPKATFHFQDYGTDYINKTGIKIQYGWTAINGNGTGKIGGGLTFPKAFSTAPIVIASYASALNSNPSAIGDLTVDQATGTVIGVMTDAITTTGFNLYIHRSDGGTFTAGWYYGATWVAIGAE